MIKIICNGKMFTDIEAIFFDKDGTIEDSRLYCYQLANERIRLLTANTNAIADNLRQAFGVTKEKIYPQGLMAVGSRQENELAAAACVTNSDCGWYQAKKIVHQAFEEAAKNITPTKESSIIFPGTLPLLQKLITAKCQLGIISADSFSGVNRFIEQEQLKEYFGILIGSDYTSASEAITLFPKPDPKLYLQACQSLAVEPQKTLMVGDSLGDIIMAQQAGAAGAIAICRENLDLVDLSLADVTITHLEDIKILTESTNYLIA